MKKYLAGVLTVYLTMSVLLGGAIGASMPALNWKGMAYFGLTHPAALFCTIMGERCSTSPPMWLARHMFTFEKETRP